MTLGVGNYLIPPLGNCLTLQGLSLGNYLIADTLRDSGVLASMGSRGDAYDNAAAEESFMATIKTELVKRTTFKSRDAARLAIFEYIEAFYNPLRRHSTLGYESPVEFEQIYSEQTKEAAAA